MAIDFHDRRNGEHVSLSNSAETVGADHDAVKAKINSLREGLINEGIPSEKKVHKHADSAIHYIDSALKQTTDKAHNDDMARAHGHVDQLADMAYYDGAPEHRDLGENIQEHISKLY